MRILHSSDLHGKRTVLLHHLWDEDFDVWIDSGDFFPNKTRGNWDVEPGYQRDWFRRKNLGKMLVARLNGRPLISVGGNHDYANLVALVKDAGGRAFDITLGPTVIGGLTFSGFREVPWLAGEWRGETHDFTDIVDKTMEANPHVLVTHSPPMGILDVSLSKGMKAGIPYLTSYLTYRAHRVQTHLFGHIHPLLPGRMPEPVEEMGITFSNAATSLRFLDVGNG